MYMYIYIYVYIYISIYTYIYTYVTIHTYLLCICLLGDVLIFDMNSNPFVLNEKTVLLLYTHRKCSFSSGM